MATSGQRSWGSLRRLSSAGSERFSAEFLELLASRLRVICLIGAVALPGFGVLDVVFGLWIAQDIPLAWFFSLRLVMSVWFFGLWVILRNPGLGERALMTADWLIFVPTAAFSVFLGLHAGGIGSGYYVGVVLVVFTRGLLVPGGLLRSAGVILGCWAAYPAVVFIGSLFMPQIAAQLSDSREVGRLVSNNVFIFFAVGVSGIGAWLVNRLQLQEYRLKRIGRYQILRELGAGGMGVVYLARHGVLKRTLAVKLLGSKHPVTDAMRLRFEREARHTSQLSHPNTIQIFDFGVSDDGRLFYAMEFVEGLDLRRIVDRYGPLSPARAIYLVYQACLSLQHAHDHGIVHRDVKPENCIASGLEGEPDFLKVLDFGLAKVMSNESREARISQTGAVLGTPHYMAPEMARNQPVDGRTDIYSLGCLLYFLLTGRPTFQADSWVDVLLKHTTEPPQAPSALNADVPPELDAVVLRCLEKDPADRFARAADMGEALLACRIRPRWHLRDAEAWWRLHGEAVDEGPLAPADESAAHATTIDVSRTDDALW